jgi:hypothetical protein
LRSFDGSGVSQAITDAPEIFEDGREEDDEALGLSETEPGTGIGFFVGE